MPYKDAEKRKAYMKEWREKNPNHQKEWREKNPYYHKQWYQIHIKEIAARRKQWVQDNKEYWNAYHRGMFRNKIKSALNNIIRRNQKTNIYTPYLGCTCDELREHIAQLCLQRGTTLDNFKADGFTLDHVVPFNAFDAIEDEQHFGCEWQRRVVSHYSNLQLLTLSENSQKGTSFAQKDYDLLVATVL